MAVTLVISTLKKKDTNKNKQTKETERTMKIGQSDSHTCHLGILIKNMSSSLFLILNVKVNT